MQASRKITPGGVLYLSLQLQQNGLAIYTAVPDNAILCLFVIRIWLTKRLKWTGGQTIQVN